MVPELKPCPFCGGPAKHNEGGNSVYGRLWWRVWCEECNFEINDREEWHDFAGPMSGRLKGKPMECIETWNRRDEAAPPAPSVAVMADLPERFEEWWTGRDSKGEKTLDYNQRKQLAWDAFYAAALSAQVQDVAEIRKAVVAVLECYTIDDGTIRMFEMCVDELVAAITKTSARQEG